MLCPFEHNGGSIVRSAVLAKISYLRRADMNHVCIELEPHGHTLHGRHQVLNDNKPLYSPSLRPILLYTAWAVHHVQSSLAAFTIASVVALTPIGNVTFCYCNDWRYLNNLPIDYSAN